MVPEGKLTHIALLFFFQFQCSRVDAKTFASCMFSFHWTVIKNVSQVSSAFFAQCFHASHSMGKILSRFDRITACSCITWPSRAGVKFVFRRKEYCITPCAVVHPFFFGIVICSGKCRLCSFFP